jgi:hypothetical protein
VNDQCINQGGFVALEEVFDVAMDELEAREPGKSQVVDTIQDILNNYDLTSAEQNKLAEKLLSEY